MSVMPPAQDVVVFRSQRRQETYVYLPAGVDFENLPDALRKHFGQGVEVLSFHLDANRQLAQADAATVLAALQDQGFYLQVPPTVTGQDT